MINFLKRIGMSFLLIGLFALFMLSPRVLAAREQALVLHGHDGMKLNAKLLTPSGDIKAIALILPGAGPVGMDGDVSGPQFGNPYGGSSARMSMQLAEALAYSGVASIRYEKRAYMSPREPRHSLVSVLAQDALAVTRELIKLFPKQRLGLVGFDEGAYLALRVASEEKVDGLFVFGLSTRTIDEQLRYQYYEWPIELLKSRLRLNGNGELALEELRARGLSKLPLAETLSPLDKPFEAFDANHNGALSIESELRAAYDAGLAQLMATMHSPALAAWYEDLKSQPPARDLARRVNAPITVLYQALDDAHLNPRWFYDDLHLFAGRAVLRPYAGLGHCFAPMSGAIGQLRTSGPMHEQVVSAFTRDVSRVLAF